MRRCRGGCVGDECESSRSARGTAQQEDSRAVSRPNGQPYVVTVPFAGGSLTFLTPTLGATQVLSNKPLISSDMTTIVSRPACGSDQRREQGLRRAIAGGTASLRPRAVVAVNDAWRWKQQ